MKFKNTNIELCAYDAFLE